MAENRKANFDHFAGLSKGDQLSLHFQELNPKNADGMEFGSLVWHHDSIIGDLILGRMELNGFGMFGPDAFLFRPDARPQIAGGNDVWLSHASRLSIPGCDSTISLTGGPVYTSRLRPSDVIVSEPRRNTLSSSSEPKYVRFSRTEFEVLAEWSQNLRRRGFDPRHTPKNYHEYRTHPMDCDYDHDICTESLRGYFQVLKIKTGFLRHEFVLRFSDSSYRTPNTNPRIVRTMPGPTTFAYDRCNDFKDVLTKMNDALDRFVERNAIFEAVDS